MLQQAIQNKVCDSITLMRQIHIWRLINKKIIFTNGCFDVLHAGHTYLLNCAADSEKNAILIAGLNCDDSVKRLKGDLRPVNNFNDRANVLASLHAVSAVIKFDEDTPIELIKMIQPDILVKGGDWREENIIGSDVVKNNGGRVVIIPFMQGYSSTALAEKIKAL